MFDPPPIRCPQDKGMEVQIYSSLSRVDTIVTSNQSPVTGTIMVSFLGLFDMSLVTKSPVCYVSIYGGSSVWGSGWWFSILLLWRRIDMAYFIAIVLMFLKVFLMVGIGILNLFSSDFIDGMCVVALAPAVIMIRSQLSIL
jgi:hypothetical protein